MDRQAIAQEHPYDTPERRGPTTIIKAMNPIKLTGLIAIGLLAGCSSLPTCGTPEAAAHPGNSCSAPWWSVGSDYRPPPTRDYINNPIVSPTTTQQPVAAQPREEYKTIAVNTPNGLVYKRCKMLNGRVVACF